MKKFIPSFNEKVTNVLIRVMIFCVIFMIFNMFQNSYNKNYGTRLISGEGMVDFIQERNDDSNFQITFQRSGTPVIFERVADDKLKVYTYSDKKGYIDEITTLNTSRNTGVVLTLDKVVLADYANNKFRILEPDGSTKDYKLFLNVDDITIRDIMDNLELFTEQSILFDEFFYYEGEALYKRRPNFKAYYDDYKNGLLNLNQRIGDIKDKKYCYYTLKDSIVDEEMIPSDDKSLQEYLKNPSAEISKIKHYNRFIDTPYTKEDLLRIVKATSTMTETESAYTYIRILNEGDY